MKTDFQSQMAALHEEMNNFKEMTIASVRQLNTKLQSAQKETTEVQAENFAMAAELCKLRGAQNDEDIPQDTRPGGSVERPMDVDPERTGLNTLHTAVPKALGERALVRYGTADSENIEYAEEDDNGGIQGGEEEEYADDESEDQGEASHDDGDVDMREVKARLQPPPARRANNQILGYVEVSDDDGDDVHGSDVSMDEDATASPSKKVGTYPPFLCHEV